ncbi:FISUMP domain-containing protein [Cyclobacterium amurskyense]|nr:FISUMP domain-containing protein [Cyclobacterium amurskyense]
MAYQFVQCTKLKNHSKFMGRPKDLKNVFLKVVNNCKYLVILVFFSCLAEPPKTSEYGELYDFDGNKYLTIKIGNQIWMAENLKTTSFSNGDPIQELRSNSEWGRPLNVPEVIKPGWSYYENDPLNNEFHGKFYNWYAIADQRNCCPDGWRIPTKLDFDTMMSFLGDKKEALRKIKKDGDVWPKSDKANNKSGFSAYPSGYRNNGGDFYDLGRITDFWVSDSYINSNNQSVKQGLIISSGVDDYGYNGYSKEWGHSVRCIKH